MPHYTLYIVCLSLIYSPSFFMIPIGENAPTVTPFRLLISQVASKFFNLLKQEIGPTDTFYWERSYRIIKMH